MKSPIKQMFEELGIKKNKKKVILISARVETEILLNLKKVMGRNGVKSRSKLINDLLKKYIEVSG